MEIVDPTATFLAAKKAEAEARSVLEKRLAEIKAEKKAAHAKWSAEEDAYMTSAEYEKLRGLKEGSSRAERVRGGGPKYYKPTLRKILYKKSDVLAWIERRSFTSTAEEKAENASLMNASSATGSREAARKAEQDRMDAAAKAERERLAEEARIQREKIEAEEKQRRAVREAEEAAQRLEREKLEAEKRRLAAEREAAERAEFERQAKVKAEQEAVEKVERDRVEKARREAELAALRPDVEKVAAFVAQIRALETPMVQSKAIARLLESAWADLDSTAAGLEKAVAERQQARLAGRQPGIHDEATEHAARRGRGPLPARRSERFADTAGGPPSRREKRRRETERGHGPADTRRPRQR